MGRGALWGNLERNLGFENNVIFINCVVLLVIVWFIQTPTPLDFSDLFMSRGFFGVAFFDYFVVFLSVKVMI